VEPPAGARALVPRSRRIRGGWAIEGGAVYAVYQGYSWTRNQVTGSWRAAFDNARRLIGWQKTLHINEELRIQRWFLSNHPFISFWNIWYGSIHFVMPVVTLVWLYRADPARYVRYRNIFLFMLPFALLGFWLFPLMPPRLLDYHCSTHLHQACGYGFVDTRFGDVYLTIGKQVRPELQKGNLFAAMPSLHIALSTWTAMALWPRLRHWWSRTLLVSYPPLMLFATVVTANHYFLDAVGGWVVLAIGFGLAVAVERVGAVRHEAVPAPALAGQHD
jgi:membrane-associated phospholipid phosphatase